MKKIVLSLGLGLTLITGAFAADHVIDQLNSQIVSIFAPFQNENTTAQLTFNELGTDTDHVAKITVNALYRKVGSNNTFEVKADNLSYDYGDGSCPTTIFKGSLGIDFTKILSINQINILIPLAAQTLEALAKSYLEQYGLALSIRSVVTSMTKDSNENYTGLTALISAKIDLTKLPENMQSEDVLIQEAVFSLALNVNTGLMIDSFMVHNPDYIGFKDNQQGLKEELDKLLARDEGEIAKIAAGIQMLDDAANQVVEYINHYLKPFLTFPVAIS